MRLPIRLRLTLVSASLMAAVLLGLAAFLYVRLEADLIATVDSGLRSRAAVLLERIGEGGGVSGTGISEADEAFAQLLTPAGEVVASSANVSQPMLEPGELDAVDGTTFLEKIVPTSEEPVEARLLVTPTSSGELLVVGAALEDQRDALAGLASLLLIGIPAAVALTALVGWVVAGIALRPVDRMRREADAISASEPGRRLADPGTGDELAELAASLNHMLGRLEEAADLERRFLADASHELRTPLANLRTEVDLAVRRARTQEELMAALSSVREETDRLIRLAEDLLVLARFSEDRVPLRREPVELGALVDATVGGFTGRAQSLGVELSTETRGAPSAFVDSVRIGQAVGNLVDNALRHTPRGGRVRVSVQHDGGEAVIAVADTGPGISPDFLPRLGERFSRPDLARGRAEGGAGLGLAIVRAIVEAHGGRLTAENPEGGGARVTISLPAEAA